MDSGILIIDKPQDFTSHDVIAKLRGMYKMKQIGHAGTLDPIATGVLVVLLGKATRASDYLMAEEKEYVAQFQLGKVTDTQDITGNILSEAPVNATMEDVKNILSSFIGELVQVPPMYSAIQIDGKRLYDLARKGIEVERKGREIEISDIEFLSDLGDNTYEIKVKCSKGTYIRTLCHDIGGKLGCGATMTALRRTKSGDFEVEKAVTLEEIQNNLDNKLNYLLATETGFKNYPKIVINAEGKKRALNGAFLEEKHIIEGEIPKSDILVRVFSEEMEFLQLGIGGILDMGGQCIFCKKSFADV